MQTNSRITVTLKRLALAAVTFALFTLNACTGGTTYSGEVVAVSDTDGVAIIKTKTADGHDTLLTVYPQKGEHFTQGQTLTVWCSEKECRTNVGG